MSDAPAQTGAPEPERTEDPKPESQPDNPADGDGRFEEKLEEFQPVLADAENQEWRQQAQNIFNFLGPTDAGNAGFGHVAGVTAHRISGSLPRSEVDHALRHLVPTTAMAKAIEVLRRRHVVVLTGPEGHGKRTCALAVLRAVTDPSTAIKSLPPTDRFTELADYEYYREGRGVLLQDQISDARELAVQKFDVDRLHGKLRTKNAYLVVTTNQTSLGKHDDDLVVVCVPPDPVAVFDAWLESVEVAIPSGDREKARHHIKGLRHPRDVVQVVERLPEGAEIAVSVLGEVERAKVTDWFDSQPTPLEVMTITTLSFLHGVPELEFQSSLARLVTLYREYSFEIGGAPSALERDALRQQRSGMTDENSLDTVTRTLGGNGESGDRRRTFTSVRYREHVIRELSERYNFELWIPLRSWLDEATTVHSGDSRIQLALGVSLLAKYAPDEVEYFLGKWANGLAGERLTAYYVLSLMCADDLLASMAWRITLGWITDAGPRRAATAAMALGGPLGIRYPWEALNHLWSLALRAAEVSDVARTAMALLLQTTEVNPESGVTVLRFLRAALDKLLIFPPEPGERPNRRHHKQVRKALYVVLTVLSVRTEESSESMTAVVLRVLPQETSKLGGLWAEVLRSAPHRAEAIDALFQTLTTLGARDDHVDAVATLGEAIRDHLSKEECHLLHRDLASTMADPEGTGLARPLLAALLTALRTTASALARGEQ
jgi:hypothetical protein